MCYIVFRRIISISYSKRRSLCLYYTEIKHSGLWENSRNVENTRLRLFFSTLTLCSQMPLVFSQSVIHGFLVFCIKLMHLKCEWKRIQIQCTILAVILRVYLIARLEEHCTSIEEVRVRIRVQVFLITALVNRAVFKWLSKNQNQTNYSGTSIIRTISCGPNESG